MQAEADRRTKRWVINLKDIEQRKQEEELSKLYKHAYLAWQKFYGQEVKEFPQEHDFMGWSCCPKLLTYPIPEKIRDCFGKAPDKKNGQGPTMVFRRFDRLELPDYVGIPENILTKALLGLLDHVDYRFSPRHAVLTEAWTINLKGTKKLKENQNMIENIDEELKDLVQVYKETVEHLVKQEDYRLSTLIGSMKDYIKVYDERKLMERKLKTLKQKLEPKKSCEECENDEDEE